MRSATWMIVATISLTPGVGVQAQTGLMATNSAEVWPRWQTRLTLGLTNSTRWQDTLFENTSKLTGSSLLGDYYFYRIRADDLLPQTTVGGFRATSGMLFGQSSPAFSFGWGDGLALKGSGLSRQPLGLKATTGSLKNDATAYFGLGYTIAATNGGWGFSADVGLSTVNERSSVRLGRSPVGGSQNLEETLRDMHLSPLLQLGVSYSF